MTATATTSSSGGHRLGHGGPSYLEVDCGVKGWLVTLDHKRVGILYLVATSVMLLLGGVLGVAARAELTTPSETMLSASAYGQVFTLHGAIMVFLFLIPSVPAVLGNFLLPVMIGARGVAFPRLNLLSFYVYVVGALLVLASFFAGGIGTGWTLYPPLSLTAGGGAIVMALGIIAVCFSSILTGVNLMATVHGLRAPGVDWARLPLFVWGIYATAIVQILATPVLVLTLVLLVLETQIGIGVFDPRLGGDPVLFQHFFWFYAHPAVYVMVVPGMAVVSEIIATFSRRRIFGYTFVAMSSIALALLGFLGWGQHMFVAGMSEYATMVFSALSLLAAVPAFVVVCNWIATLHNGSISFKSPMLYGMAFVVLFTGGILSGLFLGAITTNVVLHDTYFGVAHLHLVTGATLLGFIGGLHYWWPKMTGKLYDEMLAKVAFVLVFAGLGVTCLTQLMLGDQGMPSRSHEYLERLQSLHGISSAGSFVLGAGFLVMAFMFLKSLRSGLPAPPNPWGSAGYEWNTASPPLAHNWNGVPTMSRGPYDYHLATAEELWDGFPEDEPRPEPEPESRRDEEE